MWRWLTRKGGEETAPLTGAPAVRRKKVYTGESGYVYEYRYEGYRVASRDGATGAEYVFRISPDRKNWSQFAVFLGDDGVAHWERERERDLNSTERYAIVKMALFRAFDARDTPAELAEETQVPPEDIAEILEILGMD